MNNPLSRRRFLALAAVIGGGAAVPWVLSRRSSEMKKDEPEPVIWKGIALGSGAELRLYHDDRAQAQEVVNQALAEVVRLEKIFSLYRDDSTISRLNRAGRLNHPPADLLALLSLSAEIHKLTGGAFDPTVQPLWNFYADYFRAHPNAETPPSKADMNKVLQRVGFDKLVFDDEHITFARAGMGLSLNGIAQGYITDKVVALLQRSGIRRALVDMGEIRAWDADNRRSWQVGIRNPQDEQKVLLTVALKNQAFATSGGYGTTLDEAGRFTHLFDPRTGLSTPRYRSMSVMAPNAAVADAFSTAFSIMDEAAIRRAVAAKQAKVWLVMPDNSVKVIG